uniref:RNA-directed RNA polymerase L n=1 Tax=Thrips tabaci associated bunyavirales 1 TaxID=2771478 RepID=A0A7H1D351_9VIRU|nr:putative RNA dependent RNA polymerase [Thrips tabaci associated bunyavirales 1]
MAEQDDQPMGQKIMELYYDAESLDLYRQKKVHAAYEPVIVAHGIEQPDIRDQVTVYEIDGEVTWKVNFSPEVTASLSSRAHDVERVVSGNEKFQIRHNYVAEPICGEHTDIKLSQFMKELGNRDDNLTPDGKNEMPDGTLFIFEIGTTMSNRPDTLRKDYISKVFKYQTPVEDRLDDGPAVIIVIIVGPMHIASPIPLPKPIRDELAMRYHIGRLVEDVGLEHSIMLVKKINDVAYSWWEGEILSEIQRISHKESYAPDKLFITDEFIKRALEPVNEEDALTSFRTAWFEANTYMLENIHKRSTAENYLKKVSSIEGRRTDVKPVVIHPCIVPSVNEGGRVLQPVSYISAIGPNKNLIKIWNHAFDQMRQYPENWKESEIFTLLKEAYETDPEVISKLEEVRHGLRDKRHRVDMSKVLKDHDVREYLALDGVLAKAFKGRIPLKQKSIRNKMPFAWTTNLDDIDDHVTRMDWFEKTKNISKACPLVNKMIEQAIQLSDNNSDVKNELEGWQKTKLFQYLEFLSDLAMELSIGQKKYGKKNEMTLRWMRRWNVWLLVKTTSVRSHTFYSLLFPNKSSCDKLGGLPFRGLHESSHCYYTDFVSVKVDKLENMASSSANLIAMISFWSWFYKLKSMTVEEVTNNQEAVKMINLSVLIRLEDKAETEDSMLLTRYAYMECFKGGLSVIPADPLKILGKYTTCIRSRLNLWVIKQVVQNFTTMSCTKPMRTAHQAPAHEESDSSHVIPLDGWSNLLNCFTGAAIPDATRALQLMYLGYLKNKNYASEKNMEQKLIEKVIEEEMTLDCENMEKSSGKTEPSERPGPKQFNLNSVIKGATLMEKKLKKMYGPDWKNVITKDICSEMASKLTHEIASLKASSTFEHTKEPVTTSKSTNEEIKRRKVIESIALKIDQFGLNPLANVSDFMTVIEASSAGVLTDLFKKAQHQGIREIYVLTIESRIVQLFIETISRVLCYCFPEETLTHPENKIMNLDNHKIRSAQYSFDHNCAYMDLCNSSDKTRWNQNFTMPALSVPLLRLTSAIFHNAIQRILNLWANKLIKIPPAVCDLLLSKVKLSEDSYLELLRQFWNPTKKGASRVFIMKACGSFVNITTGMMQGILHFTSSLLHVAYLYASKHFCLLVLNSLHADGRFTMSQVCSSDDSATILSMFSPDDKDIIESEDLKKVVDCEKALVALTIYCEFFCMRESVKSTIGMYDYVEFNSEFIFKNTLAVPVIKLVCAATGITEAESYKNRFHTQYNLLSDLFAAGFPSRNCHGVQLAQAWMHYKTMGSGTSALFENWQQMILTLPDSTFGFFYLDSMFFCGVLGHSYSRWLAHTRNELLQRSINEMNKHEMELLDDGTVIRSMVIKNGDLSNWHRLMDSVANAGIPKKLHKYAVTRDKVSNKKIFHQEVMEERKQLMEGDPELFFEHPKTMEALRIKMLMKASAPGVGTSLGKGSPFQKAMASTAFSQFTHCFTRSSITCELMGGVKKEVKKSKKTSLLLELKEQIESVCMSDVSEEEATRKLALCFPLESRYSEAYKIHLQYKKSHPVYVGRVRTQKTVLHVQPRASIIPLTMQQTACWRWFSHSMKYSNSVCNRCVAHYVSRYPWFKESFAETLKFSPFQTAMELAHFVSSEGYVTRKVRLHGPRIFSTVFSGQMAQISRKYYMEGHFLELETGEKPNLDTLDEKVIRLSLALHLPFLSERDKHVQEILKSKELMVSDALDLSRYGQRDAAMLICGMVMKGAWTTDDAAQAIQSSRCGIMINYTKPQRKEEMPDGTIKWVGEGEAVAINEGQFIRIMMDDEFARKITIKDLTPIRQNPDILVEVLKRLRLRTLNRQFLCANPNMVARLSGQSIVDSRLVGTPIIVDHRLDIKEFRSQKIFFKIREGVCGLYTKIQGTEMPVLEIRARVADLGKTKPSTVAKTPPETWIEGGSLDAGVALNLIDTIQNRILNKSRPNWRDPVAISIGTTITEAEKEGIARWLKKTLLARIKTIGVSTEPATYQMSIPATALSDNDQRIGIEIAQSIMAEFMAPGGNVVTNLFRTELVERFRDHGTEETTPGAPLAEVANVYDTSDIIDPAIKKWLDVFNKNLDSGKKEDLAMIVRHQYDINTHHPFWDNLINKYRAKYPDFFTNVLHGVVYTPEAEGSRLFMWALGIKEQKSTTSLTARLKSSKTLVQKWADDYLLAGSSRIDEDPPEEVVTEQPGPSHSGHQVEELFTLHEATFSDDSKSSTSSETEASTVRTQLPQKTNLHSTDNMPYLTITGKNWGDDDYEEFHSLLYKVCDDEFFSLDENDEPKFMLTDLVKSLGNKIVKAHNARANVVCREWPGDITASAFITRALRYHFTEQEIQTLKTASNWSFVFS